MRQRLVLVSILALVAALACGAAHAGPLVSIGFQGGLSIAGVSDDNKSDLFEPKTKLGPAGGLCANLALSGGFSLQPEVLFVSKGFSYGKSEATDTAGNLLGEFETLVAADFLEVPVLLRYEILPAGLIRPALLVGPGVGFKIRERVVETGAIEHSESSDDFDATDFTLNAGVGLSAPLGRGRCAVDARYAHGLTDLARMRGKSRAVVITAGYSLALGR